MHMNLLHCFHRALQRHETVPWVECIFVQNAYTTEKYIGKTYLKPLPMFKKF
jgi:hypothetical protein